MPLVKIPRYEKPVFFPDTMSEEEISAAINEQLGTQTPTIMEPIEPPPVEARKPSFWRAVAQNMNRILTGTSAAAPETQGPVEPRPEGELTGRYQGAPPAGLEPLKLKPAAKRKEPELDPEWIEFATKAGIGPARQPDWWKSQGKETKDVLGIGAHVQKWGRWLLSSLSHLANLPREALSLVDRIREDHHEVIKDAIEDYGVDMDDAPEPSKLANLLPERYTGWDMTPEQAESLNFWGNLNYALITSPAILAKYILGTALTGNSIAGLALVDMAKTAADPNATDDQIIQAGVKGALLGTALRAMHPLSMLAKSPVMGGLFGGMAYMEGASDEDVLVNTIVGSLLPMMEARRQPPSRLMQNLNDMDPVRRQRIFQRVTEELYRKGKAQGKLYIPDVSRQYQRAPAELGPAVESAATFLREWDTVERNYNNYMRARDKARYGEERLRQAQRGGQRLRRQLSEQEAEAARQEAEKLPDFQGKTMPALEFGRKNKGNEQVIEALEQRYREEIAAGEKLMERDTDEGLAQAAHRFQMAQPYREAAEAARGIEYGPERTPKQPEVPAEPPPETPAATRKPARVSPKAKQAKTALSFVRLSGGIKPSDAYKGEVERFSPKESGIVGIMNRRSGKPADRMREALVQEGWLRDDATLNDMWRLLDQEVARAKGRKPPAKEAETPTEEQIAELDARRATELARRGELRSEDLEEGQVIITADDVYFVDEKSGGGLTLKDGKEIKLDPWDLVEARRVYPKGEISREQLEALRQEWGFARAVEAEPPKRARVEPPPAEPTRAEARIPDLNEMVKTARAQRYFWAKEVEGMEPREQMQHMKRTTKADLDRWIMDRFRVDESTARDVSNLAAQDPGFRIDRGKVIWEGPGEEPTAEGPQFQLRPTEAPPEGPARPTQQTLIKGDVRVPEGGIQAKQKGQTPLEAWAEERKFQERQGRMFQEGQEPPSRPPSGARESGRAEKSGQIRRRNVSEVRTQPPAPTIEGQTGELPPAPRFDGPYGKQPSAQRRSRIIREIEKKLDVPVRFKGFRRKAPGIYKPHSKVIRLKNAQDVEIAFHEAGHAIHDLMELPRRMPKEIMDLAYEGAKNKSREGFAEWMRLFVTQESEARNKAPGFTRYFEKKLAEHPDVENLIVKGRQAWEFWLSLPDHAKIMSVIRYGAEEKTKKLPTINEIYRRFKDDLKPIQDLVKAVEKKERRKLKPEEDPYLLAWNLRGWARKAEQWVKWGRFRYTPQGAERTGPSLVEILKPIERAGLRPYLDAYLVAERARQDPRITKGFGEGLIPQAVWERTAAELRPHFEKTAKLLYDYQDDLLSFLVDSGRINQNLANRIRQKNLAYAPLYRVMDYDVPFHGAGRRRIGNLYNPIKPLKGSSRDVWSPTESILSNTYAMISVAERNRVAKTVVNLAQKAGIGKWIEEMPAKVKATTQSTRAILENLQNQLRYMQGDQAATFWDAIVTLMEHQANVKGVLTAMRNPKVMREIGLEGIESMMEKAGLTHEDLWLLNQTITTFRSHHRAGPNEVILYEDGQPRTYYIGDKALLEALYPTDPTSLNFILKLASYPARWRRAGATTYGPEFAIRNPAKDQWTAYIHSRYKPVLGGPLVALYDSVRGAVDIIKKNDMYMKFNASGGAHATIVSLDRNYLSKNLTELMRKPTGRLVRVVRHPLETVQILTELGEEATRVGEYRRILEAESRKPGRKGGIWQHKDRPPTGAEIEQLAGREVRDITLDFSRQGAIEGRMINSVVAFWNARMEGLDRMARAFRDRPAETGIRVAASVVLPSLLNWLWHASDPDRWEHYQEAPAWQRTLFWQINTTNPDGSLKHRWLIPKPHTYGILFGSFLEEFLSWMKGEDPKAVEDIATELAKEMQPLEWPAAVEPAIEWVANRNLFFDRPLVPRGREDLKPYLQYRPHTSEFLKFLAEKTKNIPVLNQIPPAKLENLIYSWAASAGRLTLDGADQILKAAGVLDVPPEPSMTLDDIPGIRGFHARYPSSSTHSIELFYEKYQRAREKWESEKEEMGVRGYGFTIDQPEELAKMQTVAQGLTAIGKLVSLTYESRVLDPVQKRRMLDDLYYAMANLARAGLQKKPLPIPQRSPEELRDLLLRREEGEESAAISR